MFVHHFLFWVRYLKRDGARMYHLFWYKAPQTKQLRQIWNFSSFGRFLGQCATVTQVARCTTTSPKRIHTHPRVDYCTLQLPD